jgi:hypothetical protein
MIKATEKDIGRKVIYRAKSGQLSTLPPEEGVITSFTDLFVFVRYGGDTHSKATRPNDLEWAHENDPFPIC